MGKDVIFYPCARRLCRTVLRPSRRSSLAGCELLKYGLVRFSSPDNCVDGFIERLHTIVVWRLWPVEPVDVPVGARDVTISTGRDVNDDLSFLLHWVWLRANRSGIGQLYLRATKVGVSRGEKLELYPLLRANSRIKRVLDVSHLRNEVCGLNQLRRGIPTSHYNVQSRLGGPDRAQL